MSDEWDAIEARLNAATPGPWEWSVTPDRRWAEVVTTDPSFDVGNLVANCADDDAAEFIAHAPEDIATLLAAVRERDAELVKLRAKVERIEALLDDEDDPYVHVHPYGGGEPDCAACWVSDIRAGIRIRPYVEES